MKTQKLAILKRIIHSGFLNAEILWRTLSQSLAGQSLIVCQAITSKENAVNNMV